MKIDISAVRIRENAITARENKRGEVKITYGFDSGARARPGGSVFAHAQTQLHLVPAGRKR